MGKSVTLGNHLVPEILGYLRKFGALPTAGIVAGQAVASAILDLYYGGGGVFNDVDVFLVADEAKASELSSEAHLTEEAMRLGLPVAMLDDYQGLSTETRDALCIIGATQDGAVNYVWCESAGLALNASNVVYSFDLNAVEVAIDLRDNSLTWTRAFEYFLRTRQLQITSVITPERTILRYFKKREELRAYGDDGLAVSMTSAWALRSADAAKRAFSSKFQKLACTYAEAIQPAFQLNESCHAMEVHSTPGAKALVPLFDRDLGDCSLQSLVRIFPRMAYDLVLQRSKSVTNAVAEKLTEYKATDGFTDVIHMSLEYFRCDYLADHSTTAHYELVKRTVDKHPELASALFGLSLDEQYHCLLDLRRRAKAIGLEVYGMVEARALPVDMWNQQNRDNFFARIEHEETHTQLAQPLFNIFVQDDWTITELLTTRQLRVEGREMNHCVGGYDYNVRAGDSRILSVRKGNDRTKWSTVELDGEEIEAGTLLVRQHYGPGNSTPAEENRNLLKEFLQWEADCLGLTLRKRSGRPVIPGFGAEAF